MSLQLKNHLNNIGKLLYKCKAAFADANQKHRLSTELARNFASQLIWPQLSLEF
jgi:hypothetical protein